MTARQSHFTTKRKLRPQAVGREKRGSAWHNVQVDRSTSETLSNRAGLKKVHVFETFCREVVAEVIQTSEVIMKLSTSASADMSPCGSEQGVLISGA